MITLKRIEYKREIKFSAPFQKNRAVFQTAVSTAAVLAVLSVVCFLTKPNSGAAQPAVSSSSSSSSASSDESQPAVAWNSTLDEQIAAIKDISKLPKGGGTALPAYTNVYGNIYESKCFAAYADTLPDILGSLQLTACEEIEFPKSETIEINYDGVTLSFFREKSYSPTYARFLFDNQTVFFYKSSSSAYDTVMENVSDKTIHYTKVVADQFLNALSNHDASALKSMVPDGCADYIDQWKALNSGTDIRNLRALPVTVDDTQAVYKVSFDIQGESASPFHTGHNERILGIGYPDGSDTPRVLLFVEAGLYNEPDTAEKQMCCNFIRYGTAETFASPSDLSADSILQYILNLKTGSVKRDMYQYTLSQQDVDTYAKSCFGIDHIESGKAKPYSDGNYYTWPKYFSPPNCRIVNETEGDDGSRFVTVEFFKDALQTLHDRYTVYTLMPNGDGTYRFASAANEDSVDVSEG